MKGASGQTFVNRVRELEELLRALDRVLAGRSGLCLVAGEPGIGKTRLVAELAQHARERGMRVLWGRCRQEKGTPPYWPWTQVVRALLGDSDPADLADLAEELGPGLAYLTQIVPDLGARLGSGANPVAESALESEHARFYLFEAMTRFFQGVAERQPLLVVFDDLQWADHSSISLLDFFAQEMGERRILTLATYREGEARLVPAIASVVQGLVRHGQRLVLGGLDAASVALLVERVAGRRPGDRLVQEIHRRSGGNPFVVDELTRLLAAEGRLAAGTTIEVYGSRVPEGVRQIADSRLAPLPPRCREILSLAAVIGGTFRLRLLERLTGLSMGDLVDALEPAHVADIIEPEAARIGVYGFTHALIREALYGALPESRRLELHRQIGEALESMTGGDEDALVDELAVHFVEATPLGGGEKALAYSRRAGRRAADRLAYEEAGRHFQQALRVLEFLGDPDPSEQCELLLALADACRRVGETSSAAHCYAQAAAVARRFGLAAALARAALDWGGQPGRLIDAWDASGRVDAERVAILEEALAGLPVEDSALRARLLARLAATLYWAPESIERRRALAREGLEMATRLGDPVEIATALNGKRCALWEIDGLAERLADARRMLALAEQSSDRERTLLFRMWLIWDLLENGDLPAVDREIAAYDALAAEVRQPFYVGYAVLFHAMRALLAGRFAEAEQLGAEAFAINSRAANPSAAILYGSQRFHAAWELGRAEELEAIIVGMEAETDLPGVNAGRALVLAELGRGDEARRELEKLAVRGLAQLSRDVSWLPVMCTLARVCHALGERTHAETLHRLLLPFAGRNVLVGPPVANCLGPVDYFLGLLATVTGQFDGAARHFAAAERRCAGMDAKPLLANTEMAQAELHLLQGEVERAGERLHRSLECAKRLGMKRLVAWGQILAKRLAVADAAGAVEVPRNQDGRAGVCRREGGGWTIVFAGKAVRIVDGRGPRYIAHLLRHPGAEIHVADLTAVGAPGAGVVVGTDGDGAGSLRIDLGHAGVVLDSQALREYREELEDLRDALEEATRWGDLARAAQLREQMDFIGRELSSAVGLGGRPRRASDTIERMRKAVGNRIRQTIDRLGAEHPELGEHLGKWIKTGIFCRYEPEVPTTWES